MGVFTVSLASFGCVFCLVCVLWDRLAGLNDRIANRLLGRTGTKRVNPLSGFAQWLQYIVVKYGPRPFHVILAVLLILGMALGFNGMASRIGIRYSVLWVGAGIVITWIVVRVWIGSRRRRWIREITYGLIDVLDLWILCLDAGMNFQAAMSRVTQDIEFSRPALRRELQLTLQEMLAGRPRDEALKHLARRCQGAAEIGSLVSHIIQAEKMGSSLTKTLQVYANSLRFNRYQDMKEWVHGMPTKLAFPLVFCILPCLLIVIGGPALLRLYEVLARH